MKSSASLRFEDKKQPLHLPINGIVLRPFLWLLCCALPLWLGAQVTPQGTFSGNTTCPGGQTQLALTAYISFSLRF